MNISIDAGPASDPDVQALATALREGIPEAKILYRVRVRDESVVHNVLHFLAQNGPRAAIYAGGVVTTKLVDIAAAWAKKRWFAKDPPGESVVIFGPDGQPIKTITRGRDED
jgi:hypothetical protein